MSAGLLALIQTGQACAWKGRQLCVSCRQTQHSKFVTDLICLVSCTGQACVIFVFDIGFATGLTCLKYEGQTSNEADGSDGFDGSLLV